MALEGATTHCYHPTLTTDRPLSHPIRGADARKNQDRNTDWRAGLHLLHDHPVHTACPPARAAPTPAQLADMTLEK